MAARTPLDSDMWWHLRAGETTWQSGRPLLADKFSFTRYGETWVNHSWLSQVGMYILFRVGSYRALSAWVAVFAVLSMGLILLQMEGSPFVRAGAVVLASTVSAVVWSPRPQIASLVLFALVGYLLYLYKWRGKNRLGWLIPIFILWSNLHGGYVLGLILMGTVIGGEIVNLALGWEGEEVLAWKRIGTLALWGMAGALVVVVNPNGPKMWLLPFQTVGVSVLQDFISEWASPDFHQLVQQPFLWLLLLTFGAVGVSERRLDGSDLVGVVFFAYLALVARRNYGPFALVAAPVLTRHLADLLPAWQERIAARWPWFAKLHAYQERSEETINPILQQSVNVGILVLLSLAAVVKLVQVTRPEFVHEAERQVFPVGAVEWINENQPEGQMFNSYNWGGYLIWHLRDYAVFVDGRTDLYGDDLLGEYLSVMGGEEGWEDVLDEWDAGVVVIEPYSPLVRELEDGGWRLMYEDGEAVVYGR